MQSHGGARADAAGRAWVLKGSRQIDYDTSRYPFTRVLEHTVFKVRPLEELHRHWRSHRAHTGRATPPGYADNLLLRQVMQQLADTSPFMKLYHYFVRSVVAPRFGGRISYSNRPKMRVHLAGTAGVSSWHRDVDVTRRTDQINVFLPFTRCFDGCALWCESEYGKGDYTPLRMEYGSVYLFDGGYLAHGTMANDTECTRVSLDFRFAIAEDHVSPLWSEILSARSTAGMTASRHGQPSSPE